MDIFCIHKKLVVSSLYEIQYRPKIFIQIFNTCSELDIYDFYGSTIVRKYYVAFKTSWSTNYNVVGSASANANQPPIPSPNKLTKIRPVVV